MNAEYLIHLKSFLGATLEINVAFIVLLSTHFFLSEGELLFSSWLLFFLSRLNGKIMYFRKFYALSSLWYVGTGMFSLFVGQPPLTFALVTTLWYLRSCHLPASLHFRVRNSGNWVSFLAHNFGYIPPSSPPKPLQTTHFFILFYFIFLKDRAEMCASPLPCLIEAKHLAW